ncbi:MAG: hypothetical protein U0228_08445 [Myxococcaceae bacterium]
MVRLISLPTSSPLGALISAGWLLVLVSMTGCPLPDDVFTISGTWSPGDRVHLLRNKFASKTRCDALVELDVTTADDQGHFVFNVLRQQVTGGVSERRFFAVESEGPVKKVKRFWFPDADLDLGEWFEPAAEPFVEDELDGHIAARRRSGEGGWPRPWRTRSGTTQQDWVQVPIDSLGRFDVINVQTSLETPWAERTPVSPQSAQPSSVTCPFVDVDPCPFQDGRFLPWVPPPDTRTLVLNFGSERAVNSIGVLGLELERPAVKLRTEFNFVVDYTQWNPLFSSKIPNDAFISAAERCTEPGLFFSTALGGPHPTLLRVGFVDESGALVPITSLLELAL